MNDVSIFEDGLMSVGEVARFLSVHNTTVWRLVTSGKLASVKIGGSRRIPRKAVISYASDSVVKDGNGDGNGSSNANEDV